MKLVISLFMACIFSCSAASHERITLLPADRDTTRFIVLSSDTASTTANDSLVFANLKKELDEKYYFKAQSIARNIDSRFSELPDSVLFMCAASHLYCGSYEECIDFCNRHLYPGQNPDAGNILNSFIGICCHALKQYEKAEDYLARAIDYNNSIKSLSPTYLLEAYASTKFQLYKWEESEFLYHRIIFQEQFRDNLEVDSSNVAKSENKSRYGEILHRIGLSCLFQGKEEEGLEYLEQAGQCGNIAARRQYTRLSSNTFYSRPAKLRARDKDHFNTYYSSLDFKTEEPITDADLFWDKMMQQNQGLMVLNEAMSGKRIRKPLRMALDNIYNSKGLMNNILSDYNVYSYGDFEKELEQDLFADEDYIEELRVYKAVEPNAFATPYGQIYLSDELVRLYDFCTPLLAGVCAHETAHYLCQHSLVHAWQVEKRRRSNNIWAGVLIGLNAAAHTASAIYDAKSGVRQTPQYWDRWNSNMVNMSLLIDYALKENTYYFQFRYSREQEIEADLLAYRFCESVGIGGYAYIVALSLLGDDYGTMIPSATSDHPTIAFRVAFLKYIYSKEHHKK